MRQVQLYPIKMNTKIDIDLQNYLLVNLFLFFFLVVIFVYSLFPISIPSACHLLGITCNSTGLSRAFRAIIHGNYQQALNYNAHSIRLFIFFTFQFFSRFVFSILVLYYPFRRSFFFDLLLTCLLVAYAFWSIIHEMILFFIQALALRTIC